MQTEMKSVIQPVESVSSWKEARLLITDYFESPPVVLKIEDSIIGTLGNFSASIGKAKSKAHFLWWRRRKKGGLGGSGIIQRRIKRLSLLEDIQKKRSIAGW